MRNLGAINPRALREAKFALHPKEDKWEGPLPKGWTDKSRAKFANSMAQCEACGEMHEDPNHPVKTCMDKIKGHVSDPGAFCASLHDRVTGTTKWRSGGKKK